MLNNPGGSLENRKDCVFQRHTIHTLNPVFHWAFGQLWKAWVDWGLVVIHFEWLSGCQGLSPVDKDSVSKGSCCLAWSKSNPQTPRGRRKKPYLVQEHTCGTHTYIYTYIPHIKEIKTEYNLKNKYKTKYTNNILLFF